VAEAAAMGTGKLKAEAETWSAAAAEARPAQVLETAENGAVGLLDRAHGGSTRIAWSSDGAVVAM
jgi:hypothetical protein